jgi:SPP1 family predicted phage head-tail adaptor
MIGDLKHRVTLQQPVLSADGGGGYGESWQNLSSVPEVYAEIIPLSGGEQLRFYQLETSVTHRLTIRYRSDVTNAMRVLKGAVAYNIVSVTDRGGSGDWLDILAVVNTPA